MSDTWLGYPQRFDSDEDCPDSNEWCSYPDAHRHGFGCDNTCPCRVDAARWVFVVLAAGAADTEEATRETA